MDKFTSFFKANYKLMLAVLLALLLTAALTLWGVARYKRIRDINLFGLEKIEISDVSAFQGFILNEEEWSSIPDPAGFEMVELIEQAAMPFEKKLSSDYTLYVSQLGAVHVRSEKSGKVIPLNVNLLSANYFKTRQVPESFGVLVYNTDEMTMFADNGEFRVKIYPKYFTHYIGRDRSAPNVPLKFLNEMSFYILVGKSQS